MLKLLIADDERIIRETISSIIDWKENDIEVVGSCKNGIEAYDTILDETPDIVLTDIRMPGMDGLELISRVSQMHLGIQFIILSGFGEFEYAQKAMQYGVRHYLLKPCNERQILDSVVQCRKEREQSVQSLSLRFKQFPLYREMFHTVITGTLNDYLAENGTPEDIASHYCKYIDFDFTPYQLFYVYFLESEHLPDYLSRLNIFIEQEFPHTLIYELYVTNTLLLFLPNLGKGADKLVNYLHENRSVGCTVTLEIQEAFFSSLRELLLIVVQKLRRFSTIYFISGDRISPTRNYSGMISCMRDIFPKLQEGTDEGRSSLQELIFGIDDPDFLKQLASNFFLRMISNSSNFSSVDLAQWLVEMDQENDLHALQVQILQHFYEFSQAQERSSQLSTMVKKIQSYVALHLQDSSLTLKQIAETELFMNVDYVSRKFYRETDQKFSQYLTSMRISKAKEYLTQKPDESIKNIAERVGCGNNPQYFSQLFKKQTGITPTEFVASMHRD